MGKGHGPSGAAPGPSTGLVRPVRETPAGGIGRGSTAAERGQTLGCRTARPAPRPPMPPPSQVSPGYPGPALLKAAIGQLKGLINQVEALRGRRLTEAQANQLASALRILATLR